VGVPEWECPSGGARVGVPEWGCPSGGARVGVPEWGCPSGDARVGVPEWECQKAQRVIKTKIEIKYKISKLMQKSYFRKSATDAT
jgi:hypothetical protein